VSWLRRLGWGALLPVVLVGLWILAVDNRLVSPDALPPPADVISEARNELSEGVLVGVLWHSLVAAVGGWAIAGVLGTALGLFIGLVPAVGRWSSASIEFARAIPAVALVPVAILIFGFDLRAELMVIAFAALWPVLVNTVAGVQLVPVQLNDTSRTLQLGRTERIVKVVVPAALPRIFVGLRLGLATAVTLMAVAEMTGNPDGLGNEIVLAQSSVRPATAMFYILMIGTVGHVLNAALVGLSRLPGLRPLTEVAP
jgi:sulfonate transport system permease protein